MREKVIRAEDLVSTLIASEEEMPQMIDGPERPPTKVKVDRVFKGGGLGNSFPYRRSHIKAIPCTYKGIEYKSILEAKYIVFFDYFGIPSLYESIPISIATKNREYWYRPDFWQPTVKTFVEIKGPLRNNMEKAIFLGKYIEEIDQEILVVLADESGRINGYNKNNSKFDLECNLFFCRDCKRYWLAPNEGSFRCRWCGAYDGDHHLGFGILYDVLPTFILEFFKGVRF